MLSLTVAMIDQYPAWSVGRSNLEALTGKTCGMAEDVLVEQHPNAGVLTPSTCPSVRRWVRSPQKASAPTGFPSTCPPTR